MQGERAVGWEEPKPDASKTDHDGDNGRADSAIPRRKGHRCPSCVVRILRSQKRFQQPAKEKCDQSSNYGKGVPDSRLFDGSHQHPNSRAAIHHAHPYSRINFQGVFPQNNANLRDRVTRPKQSSVDDTPTGEMQTHQLAHKPRPSSSKNAGRTPIELSGLLSLQEQWGQAA